MADRGREPGDDKHWACGCPRTMTAFQVLTETDDNSAAALGPLRRYASAFLVATVAALVFDAALQLALNAVRVSAYAGGAPWWVTAHVIERGRWVVFALLLWWLAQWLLTTGTSSPGALAPAAAADAWRHVAIAVIVVPVLWIVATWAVSAVRFTLLGSWNTDGRVILSAGYYRGLVLDLAPWVMAAAVVLAVRKHL